MQNVISSPPKNTKTKRKPGGLFNQTTKLTSNDLNRALLPDEVINNERTEAYRELEQVHTNAFTIQ